ncbi:hypothetical protein [Alterisphingorhabdus coralli]|uniref:DUF600 family protein n=1 Tax=Alterisphingorhabdus coralli TaxID=3071408 RepID=A0AA97F8H9_9SPHN|nr:hypothetical protein [Parasphingorhabdus sp. SCSIO 66989]WOE76106.1 hypothetical protein RB602_05165 [Parasphingorhabdus sp. SCSIO 66989]
MINYIEKQSKLLEKLANILFNTTDVEYDALWCEYECDDEFNTIDTALFYKTDGKVVNFAAPVGVSSKNLDLCQELRAVMKAHTGGEWSSFTLTLGKDGKAHTKFEYPS